MDELVLRLTVEGADPKEIPISLESSIFGRSPESDLQLPFSGVSRKHARLFRDPGGAWMLEDLGAANRTLLNGVPVDGPKRLRRGDRLTIGTATLELIRLPVEDADERASATTVFSRNAAQLQQEWMGTADGAAGPSLETLRIARLQDLVNIAKELNLAISTGSIFVQISGAVFRSLHSVDRLALLVDVERNGNLFVQHQTTRQAAGQIHGSEPSDEAWVSWSVCRKAFLDREAILTANAQADDRFGGAASLVAKRIHTAMAAPLWNEDEVVGVLYADSLSASRRHPLQLEEDLGFFTSLSNLAATATQRWLTELRLKNEEQVRRRLERYHSPAVVQKLAGDFQQGRLPPEEREISILFADIVGFTSISEGLSPAQVATLLNRFFEEMHGPVFRNGGTLDKYIGDCLMAFFGAPEHQPDHAARAVNAAREMLGLMDALNRSGALGRPIQIRIAINSGPAVVGDVGSSNRLEYTVLGSTVNLASRMEPLCHPGECLISEATHSLLAERESWLDAGIQRFRGIERDVRVFRHRPDGG